MNESVKDNMESQSNEQYPLYTEKIVVKPSVKYRKFILLMWVLAAGCIFGLFTYYMFQPYNADGTVRSFRYYMPSLLMYALCYHPS